MEIIAETAWTAPNVAGLIGGRFDAGFVRPPINEPTLTCAHVDTEDLLLAVPEQHWLPDGRSVERTDIIDEPAVMWPPKNALGMYDRIISQVWPHGGFRLDHHEPDDAQLLLAVSAGKVIAAVPEGRARALTMPGVRLLRFAEPIPTVDTALAYPTASTNPAVQHLAALLEPQPPTSTSRNASLG